MDFQVIRATREFAFDMGYVHSYSWQKAYTGIIPDEIIKTFTPENRAKIFLDVLENPLEEYYLFKVDDRPAGIASLAKSHEKNMPNYIGEIYSIYFHPDFWGPEVTQKGFQFCINRLKNLGFSEITIWVLNDNLRAKRFYERNGFKLDGNSKEIEIGVKLLEVRYSKRIGLWVR